MSLRRRLALILILATGVVWVAAMVWIQISTRARVEQALDARLAEAARMVSSLLSDRRIDLQSGENGASFELPHQPAGEYDQHLFCQLWSLKGDLVGQSGDAPNTPLSPGGEGFSDSETEGEHWRVFTAVNTELGVRVMVGDRVIMRDRLVRDVVTGLVVPALVILPLLAGLIWIVVGRGLAPLTGIAAELRRRKSDDLTPIGPVPRATELRPVVTALNDLFERVSRDRDRERSFTSYAAHELKTPLAGISAQAQIAQRASDPAMREAALAQIIGAVRRTDHVVRQLLDLASVDGGPEGEDSAATLDLAEVLRAVIADLQVLAAERGIRIDSRIPDRPALVSAPRFLVWVALRNPLENAVLASPQGGLLRITLEAGATPQEGASLWHLCITDQGPGLTSEEHQRATERFFRGRAGWDKGSGLGLSITATAMARLGGSFRLESGAEVGPDAGPDGSPAGGTRAILAFPAARPSA